MSNTVDIVASTGAEGPGSISAENSSVNTKLPDGMVAHTYIPDIFRSCHVALYHSRRIHVMSKRRPLTLKIPKSTLYKVVREGKIPSQKVGRHWRFRKEAIDHRREETPANEPGLGGDR
jgi:excisionase family DNA binding protein